MIVIVCGGRHFTDGTFLFAEMDRLHAQYCFSKVVEGGQRTYDKKTRRPIGGADFFAHDWAVLRGVEVHTERADWNDLSRPDARIKRSPSGRYYDANAGFRRNQLMADNFAATLCVGFRPGGEGTADMLRRALAAGMMTLEFTAP